LKVFRSIAARLQSRGIRRTKTLGISIMCRGREKSSREEIASSKRETELIEWRSLEEWKVFRV